MQTAKRSQSAGTAPRRLVACTTKRSIILPFLQSEAALAAMPQEQQFTLFPPEVLGCTTPLHYVNSMEQPVRAKQLGTALLSQLFTAMPADVRKLAMQAAAGIAGAHWDAMTPQQQLDAATLAVFTRPPVRLLQHGSCQDADLKILKETRCVWTSRQGWCSCSWLQQQLVMMPSPSLVTLSVVTQAHQVRASCVAQAQAVCLLDPANQA
jgi:hypothetical protein